MHIPISRNSHLPFSPLLEERGLRGEAKRGVLLFIGAGRIRFKMRMD